MGCELAWPPRLPAKPNVLLKLAPFTVRLLYELLRPAKLLPLAEGVKRVKSFKLRLVEGRRSICWRVITSAEPVRLRLNTLSLRRPATTTSCRVEVLSCNLKSAL